MNLTRRGFAKRTSVAIAALVVAPFFIWWAHAKERGSDIGPREIGKWPDYVVAWDRWRGVLIEFRWLQNIPYELRALDWERENPNLSWVINIKGQKYGDWMFKPNEDYFHRSIHVLQVQARRSINLLLKFPEREIGDLFTIRFRNDYPRSA